MIDTLARRFLYTFLGDEKYLSLISNIFLRMYHSGKARKNYPELYLLKHFVNEGDVCIDIGANVGYYSVPLAELAGNSGKVYSVEPVEIFRKVLVKNLKHYKVEQRTEIIPYALGNVDGEEIEMGTPEVDGLIHFGYTKVLSSGRDKIINRYKVIIHKPQTIFNNLDRLDFIKCDVEGYEDRIIPEFIEIIKKFKPTLQIEICPQKNRELIITALKNTGYSAFYCSHNFLNELKDLEDNIDRSCDLYFLQQETIATRQVLIKK